MTSIRYTLCAAIFLSTLLISGAAKAADCWVSAAVLPDAETQAPTVVTVVVDSLGMTPPRVRYYNDLTEARAGTIALLQSYCARRYMPVRLNYPRATPICYEGISPVVNPIELNLPSLACH